MCAKGRSLEILARNGINVPRGFSVGCEHYQTAIAPRLDEIDASLPHAEDIAQIICGLALPNETCVSIEEGLDSLDGVDHFAVRSSGFVSTRGQVVAEDSTEISLAGQFESYLNVPRALVPFAVKQCWASLFNERSIKSFETGRDYVANSSMSVVIQEMIPAKACAVMMTVDPLSNGRTGAIEFAWGACEAIVAGLVDPDEATFERSSGSISATRIGSKRLRVKYEDYNGTSGNCVRVANAPADQNRFALEEHELEAIVTLGRAIEEIFGVPQDVEAVIDHNGRVVITQARAVTTLPPEFFPFHGQLTNAC